MALIKCEECGGQVSTEAKTCPQCGAKVTKKTGMFRLIVAGTVLFVVASIASNHKDSPTTVVKPPDAPLSTPIVDEPKSSWVVDTKNNAMTGKPTKFASIQSSNSLSLAYPYGGENRGHITIRKYAGKPEDVLFSFDEGQSICRSYSTDCRVVVRFDENTPMNFSGQGPSDGSSNVIFLTPAQKFITGSKKSKHIKVSLDVYKNGIQILDFNSVNALEW